MAFTAPIADFLYYNLGWEGGPLYAYMILGAILYFLSYLTVPAIILLVLGLLGSVMRMRPDRRPPKVLGFVVVAVVLQVLAAWLGWSWWPELF